ncbi:hypothetical protein FZ103_00270 [Streptomonospora sp. PA3]|uniref:hypothetical protein n=1 Tax=Streptomonospora sp. PA3 TaxID=2607326 RepID=UPI0012DC3B0C|nr:hypothetical protein [Streptomonospora sp. PA3]MUL39628.1 hypothetical protein [Streptomonospora sp. PA3]
MPLYEYRQGGRVIERVRTVAGKFEDTRLGLAALDRAKHSEADGWHKVDEQAAEGDQQPAEAADADGG